MIENGGAPCTRNVIFERRFCTRHTGPVAVEFTVFLRARLQPPLSTGAEHTLSPQKRYPSSHCQYLHANARTGEKRGTGTETAIRLSLPLLSFSLRFFISSFFPARSKQTIRRIIIRIFARRWNRNCTLVKGRAWTGAKYDLANNTRERIVCSPFAWPFVIRCAIPRCCSQGFYRVK